MKIISTNIGKPTTIEWNGEKVQTGIYKRQVSEPIYLGREDVEKDNVMDRRYHGGVDKACYLYSADHYQYWKKLYPELELTWGMFGENLTVEGLNEAQINIGDTFQLGETVIQATQPRQPCYKLGVRFGNPRMVKQFVNSGFSGVYVRVLKNGNVKTGDELQLKEKKDSLSIQKVFELLYTEELNKEAVEKAVKDPFLAESCRRDLLKRWENKLL
jgi:MOSC domain-containing protein YiiM